MKIFAARHKGFTLIELMIVIVLMLIVSGTAMVNVTSFYQTQGTEDDIRTVLSEIRSAYSKATGVFYPPECTNLTSYTVLISSGSKDISVRANCTVPQTSIKEDVLKTTKFSSAYSFTILVPSGAMTPSSTNIMIENDSNPTVKKTLRVASYGIFEIQND